MIGRSISHYQVLGKLGEGGMGVVYKARDTHLDRFVALKILPPKRVADLELKRRFVQEAKAASALNHPNIIHIYDIDSAEGVDFIAMEYVAGKTLAELIPRKGMRLSDALRCAAQVADALARAHAAGIIHRDLKPSNVMVDEHGLVKVLDFGLAKLAEPAEPSEGAPTGTLQPETAGGMIVGTAGYMSPEQAEGKPVDARSDIFSFGSLLYEMVTGHRAFRGDSNMSTLAAIIKEEPKPPSAIVEGLPREVERVITRCLRKDPDRRFQYMRDLKLELEELRDESDSGRLTAAREARRRRGYTWVAAAAVVLIALLAAGFLWLRLRSGVEEEQPLVTLQFTSEPVWEGVPNFSPDGTTVAYAKGTENYSGTDIYLKLVGEDKPQRLTSQPALASYPEWSPDGRVIAYVICPAIGCRGTASVWVSPRIGGTVRKLIEIELPWLPDRPVAWTPDGQGLIVVDREEPQQPFALFHFSIQTGRKRRVTSPPAGIVGDTGVALSPDARNLAVIRRIRDGASALYLHKVLPGLQAAGQPIKLSEGIAQASWPAWMPEGRTLIFCSGIYHASTLWRVPADGSRPPVPLPFVSRGAYCPTVARQGNRLVYMQHVWDVNVWRVDLAARDRAVAPARPFIQSTARDWGPVYSPDGRQVAFCSERSGRNEIWLCDADGTNIRQLGAVGSGMSWSPDGSKLAFVSETEGNPEIYSISAEGGPVQRLTKHPAIDDMPRWSADARWLYFRSDRGGKEQVWKMPADGGEAVLTSEAVPETAAPEWLQALLDRKARGIIRTSPYRLAPRGAYFIAPTDGPGTWFLQFIDAATGKVSMITPIRTGSGTGLDLELSPDGKTILYTQPDRETADLVLVENFR